MEGGQDELRSLRERLAASEREHQERIAQANAAIAAAQDRSYWLDRWHLDLNAFMRTPAGGALNGVLRALQAVYRRVRR
jgi:hypothetical protein